MASPYRPTPCSWLPFQMKNALAGPAGGGQSSDAVWYLNAFCRGRPDQPKDKPALMFWCYALCCSHTKLIIEGGVSLRSAVKYYGAFLSIINVCSAQKHTRMSCAFLSLFLFLIIQILFSGCSSPQRQKANGFHPYVLYVCVLSVLKPCDELGTDLSSWFSLSSRSLAAFQGPDGVLKWWIADRSLELWALQGQETQRGVCVCVCVTSHKH